MKLKKVNNFTPDEVRNWPKTGVRNSRQSVSERMSDMKEVNDLVNRAVELIGAITSKLQIDNEVFPPVDDTANKTNLVALKAHIKSVRAVVENIRISNSFE